MARTGSPKTYAISYGLAGGPAHSRKLRKLLQTAGFKPTPLNKADIIIAHSAGTWLMPADLKPKLVMYVGMPLNTARPSQTLRQANIAIFRQSSLLSIISTQVKNSFYTLTRPRRNFQIIHQAKQAKPTIFSGVPAVFISNKYDPWPQAKALQEYIRNMDWTFISLPGAHNDISEHPVRYVELIRHYARLLA